MNSFSKTIIAVLSVMTLSIPLGAQAEVDPFPGVSAGQEIPGTRVSSSPGESQASFDAGAGAGHSCPAGSGRGVGVDLRGTSTPSDNIRFYHCVKTWVAADTTAAWAAYQAELDAAKAAAEAASLAWNQANPGKQKCVSWGPITDPDGGQSSGGVCANPVELEKGVSVPSQDAGGVSEGDVDTGVIPPAAESTPSTPDNSSDSQIRGSGYPFTQIVAGQVATAGCPIGYQAANGLIADAKSKKTYTECWPESAWTAYSLGGDSWNLFKATDGVYNPNLEVERRAKIALLVAKAKEVALAAAALTPGIERCSSWSGFGESGRECAYAFVDPASVEQGLNVDLKSDENLTSQAEVSVGLDGAVFTGSSLEIASTSLLLAPSKAEAKLVADFAKSFSRLKTWQSGFGRNLPGDEDLAYSYKTLTPEVCRATGQRILIRKPNTCVIEVTMQDSSGNSYLTKKIFKRKYGR